MASQLLLSLALLQAAAVAGLHPHPIPYPCHDEPVSWIDTMGDTCEVWGIEGWCESDGEDNFDENGISANTACCVCGGGLVEYPAMLSYMPFVGLALANDTIFTIIIVLLCAWSWSTAVSWWLDHRDPVWVREPPDHITLDGRDHPKLQTRVLWGLAHDHTLASLLFAPHGDRLPRTCKTTVFFLVLVLEAMTLALIFDPDKNNTWSGSAAGLLVSVPATLVAMGLRRVLRWASSPARKASTRIHDSDLQALSVPMLKPHHQDRALVFLNVPLGMDEERFRMVVEDRMIRCTVKDDLQRPGSMTVTAVFPTLKKRDVSHANFHAKQKANASPNNSRKSMAPQPRQQPQEEVAVEMAAVEMAAVEMQYEAPYPQQQDPSAMEQGGASPAATTAPSGSGDDDAITAKLTADARGTTARWYGKGWDCHPYLEYTGLEADVKGASAFWEKMQNRAQQSEIICLCFLVCLVPLIILTVPPENLWPEHYTCNGVEGPMAVYSLTGLALIVCVATFVEVVTHIYLYILSVTVVMAAMVAVVVILAMAGCSNGEAVMAVAAVVSAVSLSTVVHGVLGQVYRSKTPDPEEDPEEEDMDNWDSNSNDEVGWLLCNESMLKRHGNGGLVFLHQVPGSDHPKFAYVTKLKRVLQLPAGAILTPERHKYKFVAFYSKVEHVPCKLDQISKGDDGVMTLQHTGYDGEPEELTVKRLEKYHHANRSHKGVARGATHRAVVDRSAQFADIAHTHVVTKSIASLQEGIETIGPQDSSAQLDTDPEGKLDKHSNSMVFEEPTVLDGVGEYINQQLESLEDIDAIDGKSRTKFVIPMWVLMVTGMLLGLYILGWYLLKLNGMVHHEWYEGDEVIQGYEGAPLQGNQAGNNRLATAVFTALISNVFFTEPLYAVAHALHKSEKFQELY